jgi:hypothetical protein
MKNAADDFYNSFQNKNGSILLTVRLDHQNNTFFYGGKQQFVTQRYDNLMTTYVTPASRGWGFTKISFGTSYVDAFAQIKNDFFSHVPSPPARLSIADKIPPGLNVDVSSLGPAASYNENTRIITWDLSDDELYAPGQTHIVSVVTTVTETTEGRNFDNQASVLRGGHTDLTNWTYHQQLVSKDKIIHLRQVVLNRNNAIELPYMGFFNLMNNGKTFSVTSDSNRSEVEVPFSAYKVAFSGASTVYDINTVVPQNYDYAGYIATTSYSNGSHNPTQRLTGDAKADFALGNEIWVTVYLTPRSNPGQHIWDHITNDLGSIVLE